MKANELASYVKKALKEGWGYVLSGQGETYTPEIASKWAKSRKKPASWIGTPASYFVTACARWFGRKVADCSGLIIAAFRSVDPAYQDQTANTLFNRCSESGPIKTIPELPGLCVWKPGHIGVYIGDGYVIEARGRTYGVVRTKVTSRPWTHYGKLADIDYDSYEKATPAMPQIKKGSKGAAVRILQAALNREMGLALKVDGSFGPLTLKAVKQFQAKFSDIRVTGIVGEKTWAHLLADAAPVKPAPAPVKQPMPTIKKGAQGYAVKVLQEALNAKNKAGLKVDGSFGDLTQAAVISYQKKHKLKVDGVAGPQTWAALGL